MSFLGRKDSKPEAKPYTVKTTILKVKTDYGSDQYQVTVEGSGFSGTAQSSVLSYAFADAYNNLMSKVSEAIFQEDK
jgi:hypothetical protein